MKDMSKEFRPHPISQSRTMDRSPVIPSGFRTPDQRLAPRKKSHKLRRTLLTTAAAGIVGGGIYVGTQGGNESSTNNTSVTTIVDITQPPLTSPETTVITVSPTTETPTTVVERVFASPEQQAQVEAVEANMKAWFSLTPEDIAKYKETTHFDPDQDGFTTIDSSPINSAFIVLCVNLGVYQIPTADGLGFVSAVGRTTADGSPFVTFLDSRVTDPTFSSSFPGFDQTVSSHTVAGEMVLGVQTYSVDTLNGRARLVHSSADRGEMIDDLEKSIGQPVVVQYASDPAALSVPEYQIQPNPEMKEIMARINQASTRGDLAKVLEEFSTETLQSVGVYVEMAEISQVTLNGYVTVADLLSALPLSTSYRLFDGIPAII